MLSGAPPFSPLAVLAVSSVTISPPNGRSRGMRGGLFRWGDDIGPVTRPSGAPSSDGAPEELQAYEPAISFVSTAGPATCPRPRPSTATEWASPERTVRGPVPIPARVRGPGRSIH